MKGSGAQRWERFHLHSVFSLGGKRSSFLSVLTPKKLIGTLVWIQMNWYVWNKVCVLLWEYFFLHRHGEPHEPTSHIRKWFPPNYNYVCVLYWIVVTNSRKHFVCQMQCSNGLVMPVAHPRFCTLRCRRNQCSDWVLMEGQEEEEVERRAEGHRCLDCD